MTVTKKIILKDKKTIPNKRKKINWSQSLKSLRQKSLLSKKQKLKLRKSLRYILLLKKHNNVIEYKNALLLKAFLSKSGKIKSRRKTRVKLCQQRRIGKAIRRARVLGLLPFVSSVKL
jgi:small subunit ribosomal protein S18